MTTTRFTGATAITLDPDADAALQLAKAVQKAAAIIKVAKPAKAQGIFVDASFGDGAELQQYINHLGSEFTYHGYEHDRKHAPAMKGLSDANPFVPLSLLNRAIVAKGGENRPNFPSWLASTYEMYTEYSHPPFVVLKMPMRKLDYAVLGEINRRNDIPKLGLLIAAFREEAKPSSEHFRVNAALHTHKVPVIEFTRS